MFVQHHGHKRTRWITTKHVESSPLKSDRLVTAQTLLLVFVMLNYFVWVLTLVLCSVESRKGKGHANNSTSQNIALYFPLDVYAWSVGQMYSTLGILKPLSELLTRKAWESFEERESLVAIEGYNRNSTTANTTTTAALATCLPPMKIPTLNVQDFLTSDPTGASALAYLETTYGRKWRETPLLLKGLWTVDELVDSTSRRRLTPIGLQKMTDPILHSIPYFSDATKLLLEPDDVASVGDIVQRMIRDNAPHKIGSQLLVQTDPSLLDEVAPLGFVRGLLGDHFDARHLMGHPNRTNPLPGTTTVPVFVANTHLINRTNKNKNSANDAKSCTSNIEHSCCSNSNAAKDTGENSSNKINNPVFGKIRSLLPTRQNRKSKTKSLPETDQQSSCANPTCLDNSENNHHGSYPSDNENSKQQPFTGLHCEPIANVAVQLWGSRTWTLVDPHHSWKLRPKISGDGRSFYPASVSPQVLASQIPRYHITTTPGDALWLPTWTYHKVEYVYHRGTASKSTSSSQQMKLHDHHLSIGASLFHFRPIDYFRRNPLFAILLIPSLIRELLGIKTQ